ncbi:hypothetical protein CEXT_256301, partial [Caerostris extrusa]
LKWKEVKTSLSSPQNKESGIKWLKFAGVVREGFSMHACKTLLVMSVFDVIGNGRKIIIAALPREYIDFS